ncbi:hypothetical protein D3C78_773710 [compost metagenome]
MSFDFTDELTVKTVLVIAEFDRQLIGGRYDNIQIIVRLLEYPVYLCLKSEQLLSLLTFCILTKRVVLEDEYMIQERLLKLGLILHLI